MGHNSDSPEGHHYFLPNPFLLICQNLFEKRFRHLQKLLLTKAFAGVQGAVFSKRAPGKMQEK